MSFARAALSLAGTNSSAVFHALDQYRARKHVGSLLGSAGTAPARCPVDPGRTVQVAEGKVFLGFTSLILQSNQSEHSGKDASAYRSGARHSPSAERLGFDCVWAAAERGRADGGTLLALGLEAGEPLFLPPQT